MLKLERIRGRLRQARGRCPACDSAASVACGVCRSHVGPFPVSRDTQLRWWGRYESMLFETRRPWSDVPIRSLAAVGPHGRSA